MDWFKQQLANVAGTQEPIYGPSAIQSVTDQTKEVRYTELKKDDLRWQAGGGTNVETQTFYVTTKSGHIGMAQVIYSCIAGLRTTCQFNSKIIYPDGKPSLWTSEPLKNHKLDKEKWTFSADHCSLTLSEDGESYHIKSSTSKETLVDVTFKKAAPGFVVGKDGTSRFGTDPKHTWGSMRHAFWPRCHVTGNFVTKAGSIDMTGNGVFIHALQGMKPHHAACRWNFCNFQSDKVSAILMEFTTPKSYGSTVVNVGGIAVDGKLLYAGPSNSAEHTKIKGDPEVNWPEPGAVVFKWEGPANDGSELLGVLDTPLEKRTDRVDVMAEVPGFVKQIVANAAGTRPYIYQYSPKCTLKLTQAGQASMEEGQLFMEATFIS